MKAAAAVLAASLLFFLGVVTGIGRRESVPPPGPIPLGAVTDPPASSDPLPPGTGAPGDAAGAPVTTGPAAPTPPASTSPASPTSPTRPGSPTSPGPVSETTVSPPTSATTVTTGSSTTTTRPVEQVGNQVDCTKRGKGKREPCPSTTTATGDERGGGG